MPTVSVVIPTYNRLKSLRKSIESVSRQSFSDIEILVIDDGSTDETWPELQKIMGTEPRLHAWRTDNRGVSQARNLAISKASGTWIAFLDSDDEWLPEKLSLQLALAKSSGLQMIHGEEVWIRNGVRVNPMKKHAKPEGRIFAHCLPLCCISPSTSLIHKNVLDDIGIFNPEYTVCEDYDLWLRIAVKYNVGLVKNFVTIKYGGHADQLSRRFKAMDYWRVKSIYQILSSPYISKNEFRLAREELQKKAKVLLAGYQKHQNMHKCAEIQRILQLAMSDNLELRPPSS